MLMRWQPWLLVLARHLHDQVLNNHLHQQLVLMHRRVLRRLCAALLYLTW